VGITLVAAVARNGVIGSDGGLPWHLPGDLRHFKELTLGHPMVMGRRTFDSIGRALPGRRTIVVTRDAGWAAPDVEVAHSVADAVALAAAGGSTVMVVGGGEIYRQAMPLADRLEITEVLADAAGDTLFPAIDPAAFREVAREPRDGFDFVAYERIRPVAELAELLTSLRPERVDGEFVYCTVEADAIPAGVRPVVTVLEPEGLTVVVSAEQAAAAGFAGDFRCAWIRIAAYSALGAVGLTAAIAGAMAADGISCNVVAGFHHDHLFVPVGRADDALNALLALAHTRP